jgi:hypothetical protein
MIINNKLPTRAMSTRARIETITSFSEKRKMWVER